MGNANNLEIAQNIVEEVLPKHFNFRVWVSEVDESGNMTKMYTEKADELLSDILKTMKNEEK